MALSLDSLVDFVGVVVSRTPRPDGMKISRPMLPPDRNDEIMLVARYEKRRSVFTALKVENLSHGGELAYDCVVTALGGLFRDAENSSEVEPDGRQD